MATEMTPAAVPVHRLELDLEPIQQRIQAASRGPWNFSDGASALLLVDYDGVGIASFGGYPPRQRGADVEFCTEARTDLPALVREVERLRYEVRAYRAEVERLTSTAPPADNNNNQLSLNWAVSP